RGTRELPARLVAECRDADLILHAGDFTVLSVLVELELLGPVAAVCGNCDDEGLVGHLPGERVVEAARARVRVGHGSGAAGGGARAGGGGAGGGGGGGGRGADGDGARLRARGWARASAAGAVPDLPRRRVRPLAPAAGGAGRRPAAAEPGLGARAAAGPDLH